MGLALSSEKRSLLTKDFLYEQYIILKKGVRRIAKETGIGSDRTIYNYLLKNNISPRSHKYSFVSRDQSGSHNPHYRHGKSAKKAYCIDCGKELSDYRKTRCLSCNRKGHRSHFYGKPPKHGKHFHYKDNHFRSSWELKFAQYLDRLGVIWVYEPKSFVLCDGLTYTPDFYLPGIEEWIEIKGYWRDDALKKYDLFCELYPNLRVRLVVEADLKYLGII